MDKNTKTILIIILIAVALFGAYKFGLFGNLFALSPVTIDPSTCASPTLLSEKLAISDTIHNPCYPVSYSRPTILVAYSGKTGQYINTISGDQPFWGTPGSGSALVRCYQCASADVLPSSTFTRILTNDHISNPLGQATAFSNLCQVGSCEGGWECKRSSDGTYFEYTACNHAPSTPARFCGNNKCETGETVDNCCTDCGCPDGYSCQSNACQKIEEDNQTHPATCGNSVCDSGETQNNCCTDCGCPGSFQCLQGICQPTSYSCGNGECDGQETCTSCPADCGSCQCSEGQIDYVDCGEGFKPNIWATRQCINRQWQFVEQGSSACSCVDNSVCAQNYKCKNNICTLDLPTFCTSTSDCKVKGFYCDETSHSCLKCENSFSVADCEFSQYTCISNSDCFDLANNYCQNWICKSGSCISQGQRFDGCCSYDTDCGTNQTCAEHQCTSIPVTPKKPVSILNIIITIVIVGIVGFFVWLIASGKIKFGGNN